MQATRARRAAWLAALCSLLPRCGAEDGAGPDGEEYRCVRYVRPEARAFEDGLTWETAYSSIQQAILSAQLGAFDDPGWTSGRPEDVRNCEVWVAQGRYRVYQESNRDSIALMAFVSLYGGFAGTAQERSARDWQRNRTILDGRLGDKNVCSVVTDGEGGPLGTGGPVIDGFTVTGGRALGNNEKGCTTYGAGGLLLVGAVTVENCTIVQNLGGGISLRCREGEACAIRNCTIRSNVSANNHGGAFFSGTAAVMAGTLIEGNFSSNVAGGLETKARVEDTVVRSNVSWDGFGGGIAAGGKASLDRVIVENNGAFWEGGGISGTGTLTIANSLISNNNPRGGGGSAIEFHGVSLAILSSTIVFPSSSRGSVVYLRSTDEQALLVNSILWPGDGGTTDAVPVYAEQFARYEIHFSDVLHANLDADPRFVDPRAGDYRLAADSPCIDAGDGSAGGGLDLDGHLRGYDARFAPNTGSGPPWVDMGAHEYHDAARAPRAPGGGPRDTP